MSKSFTAEQNKNALRLLQKLVHGRFEGHHTNAAEAMGVSQALVSSTLSHGSFGMKLLLGMSAITGLPVQSILDGEDADPNDSVPPEDSGRKEFLRVYRGDEMLEAQRYLADEGERALRMAGTWSAAQFRDYFVRGFAQWREVRRVGADTPLAVAMVHDSRATVVAIDARKGPRKAER